VQASIRQDQNPEAETSDGENHRHGAATDHLTAEIHYAPI
jgi:hypothetical protein